MKRVATVLALALALAPSNGFAATESPTTTSTPTMKATPTPTPKASATKKAPAKKKKIAPSPSPKWPPAGFRVMDDIYYRTPSVEIMMNVAAGNAALAKSIAACKEFSCGRIQIAS